MATVNVKGLILSI